jgi:hypothetical protein
VKVVCAVVGTASALVWFGVLLTLIGSLFDLCPSPQLSGLMVLAACAFGIYGSLNVAVFPPFGS